MKLQGKQKVFKEGIIVFPQEQSKQPYLAASSCPKCQKVYFPAKDFCPHCLVEEGMQKVALSNEGRLYTFSVVHLGVKGFPTPYVLGWIEFPKEKVRLAAQIECDPKRAPTELKSGQKVALSIGKLRELEDGQEIIGYRYRPVNQNG